MRYKSLII